MFVLEDLGELALGSRLRRLSEELYNSADRIYQERGFKLSSRSFPLLMLLSRNGAMAITELAQQLGFTHSAVSQMSRKLKAKGWINDQSDDQDKRRRLLTLAPAGHQLIKDMSPIWQDIQGAVTNILRSTRQNLLRAAGDFEEQLERQSLDHRVQQQRKLRLQTELIIERFDPAKSKLKPYAEAFESLNREWLEKYFEVEDVDVDLFANVQSLILDPGGQLLFAKLGSEVIGTCALISRDQGKVELGKMAVTATYQGLGFGKALLQAAIDYYKQSSFTTLFLETNTRLRPAIRLYENLGFSPIPIPEGGGDYKRVDLFMEFQESSDPEGSLDVQISQ
jgi:DNA-binding MarR family transcriptional regulator/predicted GNAT family N-acyltransferase